MAKYNQGGGYNADSNKDRKQGPVDEMPQSPWASANSGGGFTNTGYNSGMPAFGSWQTRGQHNYSTAQRTGMKARGAINKAVGGVLGWMGKMGKGAINKARMKYGDAETPEDVLAGKGNITDLVGDAYDTKVKNENAPLNPNEGVSPYAPDSSVNYVEDDRNFIQKAWDNKGYNKKDRAAHADKSQSIMENIQRKNFAAEGLDYDDQQSYDYSAELERFNEESEMARNNARYDEYGNKESYGPDMQMDVDTGVSEDDYYMEEMKDTSIAGRLASLIPGGNKGTKMVQRSDGFSEGYPDQDYSGDSMTEDEYNTDYSGESSEYDYGDKSGDSDVPEWEQPGFEDRDLAAEVSQGKITREQYMKLRKKQAYYNYDDIEGIDSEPPNLLNTAMKNSRRV